MEDIRVFDAASVSTIIPAIATKTRRMEKCSDQCVSVMTQTFVHILTRNVRDITKAIEWLKNTCQSFRLVFEM